MQSCDLLNLSSEKSILKNLELDEKILFTSSIYKFNQNDKRQDRNIMITNQNIFNLNKLSITRRTSLTKIKAITVSKISKEFVLHVPDEYDYRYSGLQREQIILTIIKAIQELHFGALMQMRFRKEVILHKFNTTKNKVDKKKKISRIPNDEPLLINDTKWMDILANEGKRKSSINQQTQILYSSRQDQLYLEDFDILKVN